MKLLPNFERAVVPVEKLENYILNMEHRQGKHKARVFKSALEIERRHAPILAELIHRSLERSPAERSESDDHGDRWTTWHEIIGLNGQSMIVTVAWIFKRNAEQIPVFISCYIESAKQENLRKRLQVE